MWASAGGIEVVLVDMPVTADLEARYSDAFSEYRARLVEWETSRHLTVLRATRDAVGLADEDFADVIHLNAGGAEKFTAWLRTRLSDLGRGGRP